MTAISTRQLCRRFGKSNNEITAVNNLELKVPNGALFGLIGPNGAGKTTTLRMLAGLLEPTSGEIRINELPIRTYWREIQWQIGYMPDFFGVYEDLLVWEYLDFFARCYKLTPQHRRRVVFELLDLVDLGLRSNDYVHTLSRGMRQRLCLAHALVHDPQILILDEPASGLDPRARVEMRELLRELRSMGKTIVLSSHILSELGELCNSVGIIEQGRLVASGPLTKIRKELTGSLRLRLKILSDYANAKQLLIDQPLIDNLISVQDQEGVFEFDFLGDENATAVLLSTLVSAGLRISSLYELNTGLEELFLQLTNYEVS